MQNRWADEAAARHGADPLSMRVYSSRLLGSESSLVLHGGGNTSVKATALDPFGTTHDVLYVKGSGWDLATIEPQGFAPVRLDLLRRLSELPSLADSALVRAQRSALLDPGAPDPSIEAVLHAMIPFAYVDHTHADAVVAITNTPNGEEHARAAFGPRVLLVPYVMPGFKLARTVGDMTRSIDWEGCDGLILLGHGIFTWGSSARASYDAMIRLVTAAEEYLDARGAFRSVRRSECGAGDLVTLARLRREVSELAGRPLVARLNQSAEACGFAAHEKVDSIAARGPVTPDHIIRTKRVPLIFGDEPADAAMSYRDAYGDYFRRHADGSLTMLDPAPRWAVWRDRGVIAFGPTVADANVVHDIAEHTVAVIQWAEVLGGWCALSESDLFAVEYWELEQAKLRKRGSGRPLDGRVAFVTGAASGIGRAVAHELSRQGAAVVGADIRGVPSDQETPTCRHFVCDVTKASDVARAVGETVRQFGGLDILVSNAGVFPRSARIEEMDESLWQDALAINLTSHQRVLQACIPYLRHGVEPSVVVIGSKNVPAPGLGQAAYSASKAGLTQLARVAALELAADGIRVNVLHPNAVFDTGAWTPEVLAARAAAYGVSVEEYKHNNLLGVEVAAHDVALAVAALAGPSFRRTTGAQIPIDGGNDRVI
ncbi:MAG TPA: bifunctional aldolase/short-chain dehydrogenase [Gemmatimonadaceae bacterium]|nr:bifunctional aldolase/short-chain dehydrogenase [Gemmatimonadaceae bacterium]